MSHVAKFCVLLDCLCIVFVREGDSWEEPLVRFFHERRQVPGFSLGCVYHPGLHEIAAACLCDGATVIMPYWNG